MKKYLLLLILLCNVGLYAQIGVGTTSPNGKAALHVDSTTKGVLIPRMTVTERNNIASPATGLLIYQTDSTPGFYYYNGSVWASFGGSSSVWGLTGNLGTNPTDDYLGTSDVKDFILASNVTEGIRITSGGNVGIGSVIPSTLLHLVAAGGSGAVLVDENFQSLSGNLLSTAPAVPAIDATVTRPYSSGAGCNWQITTDTEVYSGQGIFCNAPFCVDKRVKLNYDNCTSVTNEEMTFADFSTTASTIDISFSYAFDQYAASDSTLEVVLKKTSDSSEEQLLLVTSEPVGGSSGVAFSVSKSVIPTDQYSLIFRYSHSTSNGVMVDNVLVTTPSQAGLTIDDGNQVAGHVLRSDATGVATWQAPSAVVGSDDDWIFASGSTNADPIYHVGPVKIGFDDGSTHELHVLEEDFLPGNPAPSGSQLGYGSVEYFEDGNAEMMVSHSFVPLVDNTITLGTTTNRWGVLNITNPAWHTSDINTKTNISPLAYGLSEILELNPISYKWKKEMKGDFVVPRREKEAKIGFSAQQLLKVLPEVVHTYQWKIYEESPNELVKEKSDLLGVNYTEIIPVAIKAIQEQQEQILQLEKEIVEIERLIKRYEKKK